MSKFYRIVRRPVGALLALVAVAGLLAATAVPAPANVVEEAGKADGFFKKLNAAGNSGSHYTFSRLYGPTHGSLKVSNIPGSGLFGDCRISIKVVNVATGATVVNKDNITLSFANPSKTVSWSVTGSHDTRYRMTVTNHGSNEPLLFLEVK